MAGRGRRQRRLRGHGGGTVLAVAAVGLITFSGPVTEVAATVTATRTALPAVPAPAAAPPDPVRGVAVPPAARAALALALRIEAALREHPEHAPRPCHNDLLAANVFFDGERVRLIDWEYAGMNDPFFDLANLAANNELGEAEERELLERYFGEPPTRRRGAALRLMRLVSDLREGMWGLVQAAVSRLDTDFLAYAAPYLARLEAAAGDPALERALVEARGS